MNLDDLAPGIQMLGHEIDLLFQQAEIGGALSLLRGDDGGAAAVPAERLAKGDVKVEREIVIVIGIVPRQMLDQRIYSESIGSESRGRRIGSVTRTRLVVF